MGTLTVRNIQGRNNNAPLSPDGLVVTGVCTVTGISSFTDVVSSGIVTADAFYGDGSTLSGLSTSAVPGISTQGHSVFGTINVSGIATFGGDISVGGTITYDDVTNVDSVGIITAGKGFRATTGGLIVTAGVSTFGANLVGKDGVQGIIVGTGLSVAGVVTATSFDFTGVSTSTVPGISTQGHSVFNTVNISGIATALEFRGDGSQLTGVGGETDITSCLFI